MKFKYSIFVCSFFLCFSFLNVSLNAQDSVRVSLEDFIERGIEESGQIDFERQNIRLAENRINQARALRFLPSFELNTQHGAIPGVKSNTDLPRDEYYLDPDLENDWRDWAIFTRAEVSAVQPIYSWGALKNAVNAAQAGAEAAREEFNLRKADLELQLFELYQSYLLVIELKRLLDEGTEKLEEIGEQIEQKQEEGAEDIDDSDVFKFEVFKSEFAIQAAEVEENISFIQETWNYVMRSDGSTDYMPEESFLDPLAEQLEELDYYKNMALDSRPEIKGIEAGIEAAEYGIEVTRARNLPSLFIGLTGSYANTPNRPRQSNPFIINSTNYASAGVGFGIRQNLDLFSARTEIQRNKIQHRQAQYLKDAAVEGIVLELNEKYKDASLSSVKVLRTDEALVTSKRWLRQEQLDYDFDMGDTKDLIDAMQKELELRVQLKERTFEFNKDLAELYKASGIPLTTMTVNN